MGFFFFFADAAVAVAVAIFAFYSITSCYRSNRCMGCLASTLRIFLLSRVLFLLLFCGKSFSSMDKFCLCCYFGFLIFVDSLKITLIAIRDKANIVCILCMKFLFLFGVLFAHIRPPVRYFIFKRWVVFFFTRCVLWLLFRSCSILSGDRLQ